MSLYSDLVAVLTPYANKIKGIIATVGDLNGLETTDKSSIVAAINEAAQSGGTEVIIDDTLTQSGQAADAKAAGDAISQLKADLDTVASSRLNFLALEQGGLNVNSGNPSTLNTYVRTISKITAPMHIETNEDILVSGVFVYEDDDTFVSMSVPSDMRSVDVNPSSGTYVRLVFRNTGATTIKPSDIQPDMTITNLVVQSFDIPNNSKALMGTKDITSLYQFGKIINNSVSVGTIITPTPADNNLLACIIYPCAVGDKFTITGTGGSTGRLWSFCDKNYRQKSVAVSSATASGLEVVAPVNGYFISNVIKANTFSLLVYQRVNVGELATIIENDHSAVEELTRDYTHITNPHYLFWRMGAFDANGAQSFNSGMLATDRFFTIVKLKKGSTVSKKSSVSTARTITFGYKLTPSDITLNGYTSDAGDSFTIAQDCIAYIGVRYAPTSDLLNDSILDTFDFDLKVVDYASRYARGDGYVNIFAPASGAYRYAYPLNYGYPCPEIYYEGQHTDETGWTNLFSDINAIHSAFDSLVSDSDGYFEKTADYGVVYTGNAENTLYEETDEWHMYAYSTVPVLKSVDTVPKVAITCCMHGNEKMSAYAMHYLIYDLIHNATKNPVLSWLKSNCIITFIPICNPYGFMKAQPSRLNENGVNLSRNFPTYNWDEWEDTRTDGNGSEQGGLNYKGESAASETETKAMMKFFRNNYDAVLGIDLHTNGANTVARDQISAYMPADPQSTTDLNYDLLHDFIKVGKCFNTRLKPWLNEKYDAGMPYSFAYGSVIAMPYYPCAPHWIIETAGLIGQCYEVMAGSGTGLMGEQLTVYAPATIKAAAEEIGNLLVTLLAHCKDMD